MCTSVRERRTASWIRSTDLLQVTGAGGSENEPPAFSAIRRRGNGRGLPLLQAAREKTMGDNHWKTGMESASVLELKCNLDDMTPEAVGFAMERLLEGGALDVYTIPCGMKKSRPGVLLCAVCREEDREEMLRLLFRHTTTLGVREAVMDRYSLDRSFRTVELPDGPVRIKTAEGYDTRKEKAEFDDLAKIARDRGISLREAAEILRRALE